VLVKWFLPGIPSGDVGASVVPWGGVCPGVSRVGDGVDQTFPWRRLYLAGSPLPRGSSVLFWPRGGGKKVPPCFGHQDHFSTVPCARNGYGQSWGLGGIGPRTTPYCCISMSIFYPPAWPGISPISVALRPVRALTLALFFRVW